MSDRATWVWIGVAVYAIAITARAESPTANRPDVVIARSFGHEFMACYQRALKVRPDLTGRVLLVFAPRRQGREVEATIREYTLPDATIGPCLLRALRRRPQALRNFNAPQSLWLRFHHAFAPRKVFRILEGEPSRVHVEWVDGGVPEPQITVEIPDGGTGDGNGPIGDPGIP